MRVLIMQHKSSGEVLRVFGQNHDGRKARREWLEQSRWNEDEVKTVNANVWKA